MRPPVAAWVVARGPDTGLRHAHAGRQAHHVTGALDAGATDLLVGADDRRIGAPELEEVETVAVDAARARWQRPRSVMVERRDGQVCTHAAEAELTRERDRLVGHVGPVAPDDAQNPETHVPLLTPPRPGGGRTAPAPTAPEATVARWDGCRQPVDQTRPLGPCCGRRPQTGTWCRHEGKGSHDHRGRGQAGGRRPRRRLQGPQRRSGAARARETRQRVQAAAAELRLPAQLPRPWTGACPSRRHRPAGALRQPLDGAHHRRCRGGRQRARPAAVDRLARGRAHRALPAAAAQRRGRRRARRRTPRRYRRRGAVRGSAGADAAGQPSLRRRRALGHPRRRARRTAGHRAPHRPWPCAHRHGPADRPASTPPSVGGDGFRDAMAAAGLWLDPGWLVGAEYTPEGGARAVGSSSRTARTRPPPSWRPMPTRAWASGTSCIARAVGAGGRLAHRHPQAAGGGLPHPAP